ncbi:MAG: guanine deaminase [Hyphomicrobiales bacterium]|jgi:guanine deaminase
MSLLLRGRTLTFQRRPVDGDDRQSYTYEADGSVLIEDGKIIANGPFDALKMAHPDVEIIDHRPHLILPGFIDPHIHYPQMQVVGSYAGSLLEWLSKYTFIEEQRFADEAHAHRIADLFMNELIRYGTTTAVAFCSVHPHSADAFFKAAAKRNMAMVGGKVMMDREAPEALTDTAQTSYDDTKALIERWHDKGRARYAITPRFAITSTPEQLEAAGTLAREHTTCLIQSHLSENDGEIARVAELYPDDEDYTAVYERFGLMNERALYGHCIHLKPRERAAMAEAGAVAVSCPTSNLFLGSGLFRHKVLQEDGIRIAYATDIGGGTSYSMLRTMDVGYKVAQLHGNRMHPLQTFFAMTLGNAQAIGMAANIGTLDAGTDADIVVLNAAAMPASALKMERVETLEEELFLLQTLADNRMIVETYVAGVAMKSAL